MTEYEVIQGPTVKYYYVPKWLWEIDWLRPILRKVWPHRRIS